MNSIVCAISGRAQRQLPVRVAVVVRERVPVHSGVMLCVGECTVSDAPRYSV